MKKILGVLLITTIFLVGLIWADSNGIWHRAEDVRAGVFGNDEGNGDFIFNNNLIITQNLKVKEIKAKTLGGNVEMLIG